MKLFTKPILKQLLENGANPDQDHAPVVKLFTPFASATWLLSEIDPNRPDIAFGLCDLGLGYAELGYVSISEITAACTVERDLFFIPKASMSEHLS